MTKARDAVGEAMARAFLDAVRGLPPDKADRLRRDLVQKMAPSPIMPRGRPPQDGTPRDRSIRVLCHSEQEQRWRAAAELDGSDLSTWVREVLDEAAERALSGKRPL